MNLSVTLYLSCSRLIHHFTCFSVSKVVKGPLIRSTFLFRQFWRNRMTHARILTVHLLEYFSSTSSRSSLLSTATANTSLVSLASASVSLLSLVTISLGHSSGLDSHLGPSNHTLNNWSTLQPLLPMLWL